MMSYNPPPPQPGPPKQNPGHNTATWYILCIILVFYLHCMKYFIAIGRMNEADIVHSNDKVMRPRISYPAFMRPSSGKYVSTMITSHEHL